MKLTQKYKKVVLEHLEDKYNERGKDFYFKSKKISKDLDISKYIIGRIIMKEATNGNSNIKVIKTAGHGSSLFKTGFECTS